MRGMEFIKNWKKQDFLLRMTRAGYIVPLPDHSLNDAVFTEKGERFCDAIYAPDFKVRSTFSDYKLFFYDILRGIGWILGFIIVMFILISGAYTHAEVTVYELTKAGIVNSISAKKDVIYSNAVHPQAHLVSRCDSNGVKKKAHNWAGHNNHKALDNEMMAIWANKCCEREFFESGSLKKEKCDTACIIAIRDSEERQRRDGKDGINQGINSGILGLSLARLLNVF